MVILYNLLFAGPVVFPAFPVYIHGRALFTEDQIPHISPVAEDIVHAAEGPVIFCVRLGVTDPQLFFSEGGAGIALLCQFISDISTAGAGEKFFKNI